MTRGVGCHTGKLAPALKNYPVTAQPGLVIANWLGPISKKRSNLYIKWAPRSLQLKSFGCFTEAQLSETKSNAKSKLEETSSSGSILLSLSLGMKTFLSHHSSQISMITCPDVFVWLSIVHWQPQKITLTYQLSPRKAGICGLKNISNTSSTLFSQWPATFPHLWCQRISGRHLKGAPWAIITLWNINN